MSQMVIEKNERNQKLIGKKTRNRTVFEKNWKKNRS
jgi:hypothetical protein